jgi:hypothetical protein
LYLSAVRYWNKVNFKGMKQSFADGGGTDNLAVTPLLRRKVGYRGACAWMCLVFLRCHRVHVAEGLQQPGTP